MLRQLALDALDKRGNIEGAAAFAAFVPLARRAKATRATSAFQAAYNLLDMLGEQPSPDPVRDGRAPARSTGLCGHAERGRSAARQRSWLSRHGLLGADPVRRDARALDWYEHHPQRA